MATSSRSSPKFKAGLDLLGRTGSREFQLRYSDEDEPTLWMAVAVYGLAGYDRFEVSAAPDPETALMRLLESVIIGGQCTHCGRPAGFSDDHDIGLEMIADSVCWTMWDPELAKFRRGCE